jgi:hypothetical protein
MSTLKKLKSIFIVEENSPVTKTEETSNTTTIESGIANTNAVASTDSEPIQNFSNTNVDSEKDEKIIDTLLAAIEKNNLGGFDYLEFRHSLKGLEKIVTDEATRYKSAFATASTMGVSMDRLVETADYYAKVLEKERAQFIKAAGDQSVNLIEKRKQELQLLLKGMGDKKKLIEQMQQELIAGEEKIKSIQEGIDSAASKIESTKQKFETSFTYLKDQITADVERIKTFLK